MTVTSRINWEVEKKGSSASAAKLWGGAKTGRRFRCIFVGEGELNGERIFVGIVHDLTARTMTARRVQDLQGELLHVSRLSAMGQMTAALAHELNQPLSAIMNYINAARRTLSNVGIHMPPA